MTQQMAQQVSRQLKTQEVNYRRTGELPPMKTELDLRMTKREDQYQLCTYEMVDQLEIETAIIESGRAFTINHSAGGMLLLMPRAPETGRYVEVRTGPTVGRRAAYFFEVRWSKPIPIESEGGLYLVGCQRTFGPLHYFQF
jgi:hypothetical protein